MTNVGKRLIAGAMSGTSADGVDVVLVETTGRGLEMQARSVAHAYEPFASDLRAAIQSMRQEGGARFSDLAWIGREVTLAHVRAFQAALAKANVTAAAVVAIGAHGQTLWHGPPSTIQYFDPSLLAIETGCTVVSDFRRADLAVGGQGAPLVPFADWILFRHPTKSRVILNIGGIANLTYLKAGGSIEEVIAFDTGPGNCLSDWLMRERGGVDAGGERALQGRVVPTAAYRFERDPYVNAAPPKSTDGPAMIAAFERAFATAEAAENGLIDRLATAAAAVASSIFRGIDFCGLSEAEVARCELIVAGGGVHNEAVMRRLKAGPLAVTTTDAHGIAADAREAIAFALLAAATLDGEPSNVPSATGARRRVVLGSITPRPV